MKITIKKNIIEESLIISQPFLNKRDMTNITSHILIDAKKNNGLNIKTTDYEIGITIKVNDVNIEEEGTTTVNGKEILNAIKPLNNDDDIVLEEIDNHIIVKQGKTKFKLNIFDYKEFPDFPKIDDLKKINLDSDKFLGSMKKIIPAIDNNNPKVELNGAYIDIKDKKINLVSTDTKRLTIINLDTNIEEEVKIIIPKKAIVEIEKSFINDIEFYCNETYIMIKTDKYTIFTKLINGVYPNYERIVPKDTTFNIELNRDDIINAIKVVSSASSNIKITFKDSRISFKSIIDYNNNFEAETELNLDNNIEKEFSIDVNSKHILDFCENIEDKTFTFNANDSDSPFILKDNNIKTVVMPIIN